MPGELEHKAVLKIKAEEDFAAAKNLSKLDGFSEEIVLFHCQQAIEKILKAYLDSKGVIYPKSHDLEVLLSICVEKNADFNQIDFVVSLTPYAVEIRYDELIEIPREEIMEFVRQTEVALAFVLKKLEA